MGETVVTPAGSTPRVYPIGTLTAGNPVVYGDWLHADRMRGFALDAAPLLRLTLLGAINWTRVWYRPGKLTPQQIAHHLVSSILRQRL